jgi:hypothetical protein
MQRIEESIIHKQQGLVLITVLLILFLLVAGGIGSIVSVQNGYRVTTNLRGVVSALYLAESGVEWTKQQMGAQASLPLSLSQPTLDLGLGHFAISVSSSTRISPLIGQVVVRSTGRAFNAIQTVQARLTKRYNIVDAALVLRGNARTLSFVDEAFSIDGRDHDPIDRRVIEEGRPLLAASTGTALLLSNLNQSLSDNQATRFISADRGRNAIARSSWLTDLIAILADGICNGPGARSTRMPASGTLSISGTIGNRSAPESHCFEGLSSIGDSVILSSINGAGILVVRDSELIISGGFFWEGLIIVTGQDVGIRMGGSEDQEVLGALAINETGGGVASGPALVDFRGSTRVLYSRKAIDSAATLIPNSVLQTSYGRLPFTINQDYWRTITP